MPTFDYASMSEQELRELLCKAAERNVIAHRTWDQFGGWSYGSLLVLALCLIHRQNELHLHLVALEQRRHPEALRFEAGMANFDTETLSVFGLPPDSLHSPGPPRSE
jgi:hypothetical protein